MESPQTDGSNHERWVGPRKIERGIYDFHVQLAESAGQVAGGLWHRPEPEVEQLATLRHALIVDEGIQMSLTEWDRRRGTAGMPLTVRERYDLLAAYSLIDRTLPLTRDERQELRRVAGSPTDPPDTWEAQASERDRALRAKWDSWVDRGGYAGLAGYKNERAGNVDVVSEACQRIAEVLETALSD